MSEIRRLLRLLFALLALGAPLGVQAGDKDVQSASLSELAAAFAREAQAAATRHHVVLEPRSLSAGDGLQASAALQILAADIDRRLGSAGPSTKRQAALPAVVEVRGGRLIISAPVLDESGHALDAVAASIPLTSAVETLLSYGPLQASGFTLRRIGTVSERVLDADVGDIDGDGREEIAALTATQIHILRYHGGRMERLASARLPRVTSRRPVRDPRGVIAIAEGSPAVLYARLADREQTHEVRWSDGRLVFGANRTDVVVSTQSSGSGNVLSLARFEPGTNQLRADVRLGTGRRVRKRSIEPFYALRSVDGAQQLALLDTRHTLHLYDRDLSKSSFSVADCGSGFAVADFVGDRAAEVLCSGVDVPVHPDRLRLIDIDTGSVLWTSPELPGGVGAIVTLHESESGPRAALLFVDDTARAGGTTLWWLRRGY